MSPVKIKGAVINFREDGITHIEYDNKLLSLEEVTDIFNATRENSPWHSSPVLATGGDFTTLEQEARNFLASKKVMEHSSAIAMVSKTLGEKMLANYFIKFSKPSKPTKFFGTFEDAIIWLKQFETITRNN